MTIFRNRAIWLYLTVVAMLATALPAMAQSDAITVDTGAFIAASNQWFPMAVQIITIGVGIAGAFALAQYVGRMILGALQGKM